MPIAEKNARIILEDGTEFEGIAFGHHSSISGEIVFYSGTADLPQLLTDPALRGSILVLSQTDAGTVGIPEDVDTDSPLDTPFESSAMQIAGLVAAGVTENPTHHAAARSLSRWMKKSQVPGIAGVDTRALIQRIGKRGSMRAKILVSDTREVSFSSANAHNQPINVSCKRAATYGSGTKRIVAVDCGLKNSSLRALITPQTTVYRVPCNHDYLKEEFDGLFIGGGPGDPTSCERTIAILREALKLNKPVFGVGQGAVILAIAGGASAYRMAQGHRGSSVPCIDLETGRCLITAQNHGYGVRDDSLPAGWAPTFLNNIDNSVEGFSAQKGLISGVLFQGEGNPGPDDAAYLYARFVEIVCNGGIRA